MPNDSKISRLILQLTKATVHKEVEWQFADAPASLSAGTGDIIVGYLEAKYRDQRLAMFERRYLGYNAETDSPQWEAAYVLAILDKYDRLIWDRSEGPSSLYDLYQVARDSAGIDRIIGKLLD